MIGQNRLQSQIWSYDYQTLPQSILIEGESGCGKHTLVKLISERFNVPVEDITKNLKYEYLSELFAKVRPAIYLVDGRELTSKDENALLKFLEEPPSIAKVIVICENRNTLLDTIQNRCSVFSFDRYTEEELGNFTSNKEILKYASTPGQVMELEKNNLTSVVDFCKLIIDSIGGASIPNTLSIINKFNIENEDGYDVALFFRIFLKEITDRVVESKESRYINAYFLTSKLCDNLKSGANKRRLLEVYLLELKKTLR